MYCMLRTHETERIRDRVAIGHICPLCFECSQHSVAECTEAPIDLHSGTMTAQAKRTVYEVEVRRKSYSTVDGATSPIDCLWPFNANIIGRAP